VETMSDDFEASYSYLYGPVNHAGDYSPELRPNQTVVERVPWTLHGWCEQFVRADPAWWSKVKPAVDVFWEDVEKAKRGEFVLPESTRAPRAKKQEMCLIVIKEGQ
jgi:hypothetical protein